MAIETTSQQTLPRQLNPFVSIWLRPQTTIRHIVQNNPTRYVLLLAAIGGIYYTLNQGGKYLASGYLSETDFYVVAIIIGPFLGVLSLYFWAALMSWFGRLLGGHGSRQDLRAALAWSQLPYVMALAIFAGGVAVYGSDLLLVLTFEQEPNENASQLALLLMIVILLCWSLFLQVRTVGAVHGVGVLKSIFIIYAILIVVLGGIIIRCLAYQPFSIPSTSMHPALLKGDYMVVNKFAYGYSQYSLPFPVGISGRLWGVEPERGDIAVFRLPSDTSVDYVKRVVGLPGDEIQMKKGVLHINGEAVKLERLTDDDGHGTGKFARYREQLPSGVSYEVLDARDDPQYDDTKVFKVPEGHYFMLGDYRDNSTDSRFKPVGFVPYENLVGRVSVIFFSKDGGVGAIRWNRIGRRP